MRKDLAQRQAVNGFPRAGKRKAVTEYKKAQPRPQPGKVVFSPKSFASLSRDKRTLQSAPRSSNDPTEKLAAPNENQGAPHNGLGGQFKTLAFLSLRCDL